MMNILTNVENLFITRFKECLWLTTYDYQYFWKLDGENIDKLSQFNRQMQDLIVNDIDLQRKFLKPSQYEEYDSQWGIDPTGSLKNIFHMHII